MRTRPFLLPLLAVAALGLSACGDDARAFAVTATVDLPAGGDLGVTGDAEIAGTDPDGRLVVVRSGAAGATVTLVAGDAVVSTTEVPLPDSPYVTLVREGELVFGELTDDGFVLHVADPVTGEPLGDRPVVPFPDRADVTTQAVATPDGQLLVAVSRSQAAPELLLVDPATGAVTASAVLDLNGLVDPERLADWSQSVDVKGIAVSPDGASYAVTATVYDHEDSTTTGVLTVVDGRLAPVTAPFVPAPDSDWGTEPAVSVAGDGTAHAFVRLDGEPVLVEVAPGAEEAETVAELRDATYTLVVRDGVAWVAHTDDPLRVTRIDLGSGEATSSVELCGVDGPAQLVPADDGGVWVATSCDDGLVRIDADPPPAADDSER
ncbi:hypothetical protein [Blastococcus sp. SYSU D00813]